MNREILFRGKHIHGMGSNKHLNGTWVQGYLSDENYIYDKSLEGEFLIDENTICQYTGLTDKNGKKIWEGDIIKYHFGEIYAPVKFGEYQSCFDSTSTCHVGFYVDWDEKHDFRKDLGYWIKLVDADVRREECAGDVKGGIDYNGYITTGRNNRKPSEVSKKNQRTDKKRGSSQARHEGGKTTRS